MTTMLVLETANNPGNAATIDLAGAPTGYRSWLTAVGAGVRGEYVMRGADGLYEWGLGYPTAGSPNKFTRETVLGGSSGAGTRVSFTGQVDVYSDFIPERVNAYADAVPVGHVIQLGGVWGGTNYDPGASEVVFFSVPLPNATRRIGGSINMQATAGGSAAEMRARLVITDSGGGTIYGPYDYATLVGAGATAAASHGFTGEYAAGAIPNGALLSLRAYRTAACSVRTYNFQGIAVTG